MSGSIRLHRQHGVNPTVGVCLFCGKDDGTVALLGASYRGQAPSRMIVSPEPCATCKGRMAQGIAIIEACRSPREGAIQVSEGVYVTGRWMVVRESAAERVFDPTVLPQILRVRKCFLEPDAFEAMQPKEEPNAAADPS